MNDKDAAWEPTDVPEGGLRHGYQPCTFCLDVGERSRATRYLHTRSGGWLCVCKSCWHLAVDNPTLKLREIEDLNRKRRSYP